MKIASIALHNNNNKMHKPTCIPVAHWIQDAWECVTAASIVNTWNSVPLPPFQPE
jgi:hypothetical protein